MKISANISCARIVEDEGELDSLFFFLFQNFSTYVRIIKKQIIVVTMEH